MDPLIYQPLHQSATLAPFYIIHLCLYYRYLGSEKESFELETLDPRLLLVTRNIFYLKPDLIVSTSPLL
jgi:hypothetical protein